MLDLSPAYIEKAKRRLEAKVRITPSCWIWVGSVSDGGYGSFGFGKRPIPAHRASYIMYVGPIEGSFHVLHKCDNRRCVNPDHLSVGTNHDNMLDRHAKGRTKLPNNKGSRNGMAKLTEDDVKSIRADNRIHRDIAADFGIARQTVGDIKKFKRWAAL